MEDDEEEDAAEEQEENGAADDRQSIKMEKDDCSESAVEKVHIGPLTAEQRYSKVLSYL